MNRSRHLFQFNATDIARAAKEEAEYHSDRVKFWKGQQREAINKAKEAGIDIREHEVTGGIDVQVVLDPTINEALSRAASKIKSHQESADRFAIESAAYFTQPGKTYELDPDDVVYFRLAGGRRSE